METKNDEERIVVNGGCFPLHWVRKFFNIATDDIEDNAVTEAKLSEAVVTKIGQAITGMKMTFDTVSGTVTLTDNGGNTVRLSVTAATESTAGLMSAADKTKVENAVKDMTLTTTIDTVTLTQTKNSGTTSTVDMEAASESRAGVMSAADKANLDRSIYDADWNASGDTYQLKFYANDGSTASVIDLDTATTDTAGLMSREDKANLAAAQEDIKDLNNVLVAAEEAIRADMESMLSTVQDSIGILGDEITALTARVAALENGGGTCGCTDIPDDEVDKILD